MSDVLDLKGATSIEAPNQLKVDQLILHQLQTFISLVEMAALCKQA